MKKTILLIVGSFILFTGCKKMQTETEENTSLEKEVTALERKCAAQEVFEEQMRVDPGIRERRAAVEEFVRRAVENPVAYRVSPNGAILIPVIVNVLYKTPAQDISQTQIESQIIALNKDFAATNPDYSTVPSVFSAVRAGNTNIEFVLQDVYRKLTNKSKWQLNDAMKKEQQGGIAATNPATMLNIWVCNLTSGYLGYAYYPGTISAPLDGVVIDDNAFGTTGTAQAPFNLGRTATHEIGHWLNLQHIWGNGTCGTDLVNDTPPHRTYNFGCPDVMAITCTNNTTTNPFGFPREMTMNYMDYTDDGCMFMFTTGQKTRMQAVLAAGGPRNGYIQP